MRDIEIIIKKKNRLQEERQRQRGRDSWDAPTGLWREELNFPAPSVTIPWVKLYLCQTSHNHTPVEHHRAVRDPAAFSCPSPAFSPPQTCKSPNNSRQWHYDSHLSWVKWICLLLFWVIRGFCAEKLSIQSEGKGFISSAFTFTPVRHPLNGVLIQRLLFLCCWSANYLDKLSMFNLSSLASIEEKPTGEAVCIYSPFYRERWAHDSKCVNGSASERLLSPFFSWWWKRWGFW